jgi:type II secretory pathway pseudopilin PulG
MTLAARTRARLAGEDGFTLVELLTAMVIGMVVVFAAFALMDRSFSASTQIADRVDAAQRGRTAMDDVMRQLGSQVCVGSTLPLQSATSNAVTFTVDLTDGSKPLSAQLRTLTFASVGGAYTLTERDVAMTSGPPSLAWAATPKRTVTLLAGAQQNGTNAFLRYFGYDTTKTPPQLKEFTSPVAPADLPKVSRIQVEFAVKPAHSSSSIARGTTLRDQMVLPQADPNQIDPTKDVPTC